MHCWGDDWPYWDELYEAQQEIVSKVRFYTGCWFMTKEKYGSIRYEYMIPPGVKAFFYSSGWKGRLERLWSESWFAHLWARLGFFVAKRAIMSAIKEKPYLADELLSDASNDERFRFPKYLATLCGWVRVAELKRQKSYDQEE